MKFFINGMTVVYLTALNQSRHVVSGFIVRTPRLSCRSSGEARPSIRVAYSRQQRPRPGSYLYLHNMDMDMGRYPCRRRGDGWRMNAAEESTGAQAAGDSNNSRRNNDAGDAAHEGGDGAGQASLASLVEKTFVMAAAGNSYQEGLKAFITVCKEAYENGYTVPALTMEVSFVPNKTAGRDLYADEVELRSIWIALVYLTLENAHWPQKVQRAHEISAPFMDRFAEFVKKVMNGAAKGHTLQTLKLEEVMRKGMEPRTPLEQAVLSQSMRIVFATLDLMKEGWTG